MASARSSIASSTVMVTSCISKTILKNDHKYPKLKLPPLYPTVHKGLVRKGVECRKEERKG